MHKTDNTIASKIKFSQIEGNGRKFSHIERSNSVLLLNVLTVHGHGQIYVSSHQIFENISSKREAARRGGGG